jgi:hypothetical protein
MGPSGRRLGQHVVETSANALLERIRSVPGNKHVCMEEGTHAEWLYEVLERHVKQVVVTQPLRRAGNKSDAIDAWAFADALRRDALECTVYKSPRTSTALRQAARGFIAVRASAQRAVPLSRDPRSGS